jgi:NADH-quinone oxidoreductase subunit C
MTEGHTPENHPIVLKLAGRNPHWVAEAVSHRGELTIVAPREHLRSVAELLCGDAETQFTFLSDLSAVDRFPAEPRFEVNYHLLSLARKDRVRLKVRLPGSNPAVESVVAVWPTANWHEREVFDLFGIRFEGHPDLRRILMPESWEGHPLRKDYPVEGFR